LQVLLINEFQLLSVWEFQEAARLETSIKSKAELVKLNQGDYLGQGYQLS